VIASAIEHDFSAVDIDSLSFYQQQQQWDVVSPRGTKCDPAVYYDDPTAAKWSHCDYDSNEVFDTPFQTSIDDEEETKFVESATMFVFFDGYC
jgi:hypothetical protein